MQRTTGFYTILELPAIYNFVQYLFTHKKTESILQDYIGDFSDCNVLDIGCGPGDLSKEFKSARKYIGIDLSSLYIEAAKKNFSEFGDFYCCSVDELDTIELPPIDIVILKGVLHHLTDETVKNMMACLSKIMKHNARFISLDPTYTEKQNPVAKFFVSKDRGVNVRTFNHYKSLMQSDAFSVDRSEVIHQHLPPYDRTLLQVRRI